MNRKQTIVNLRQETSRIIQEFLNGLSAAEKAQAGELHKWSVKDILYHIGLWDQRLMENLQAALAGKAQVDYSQYLALNDQDFSEYEKRSWQEVEEILHSSNQGLLQSLAQISDEQLESAEFLAGSEGRPAWRNLSGVMLGHPVLHITEYLVQQGRVDQALGIMLDFCEKERALDDGDGWQGLASYNQACYYALAGKKAQAQEKLAEALRLNPTMEEWSKQDPDLASLRE